MIDPYKPPTAKVETDIVHRPVLVWVFSAMLLLVIVVPIFFISLTYTGDLHSQIKNSTLSIMTTMLLLCTTSAFIIQFMRLRRSAVLLSGAMVFILCISYLGRYVFSGTGMGSFKLGSVIGILLALVVFLYSIKLRNNGTLHSPEQMQGD